MYPGLSLRGACDCHVHVFGPAARFPLDPKRNYTPPDASIAELKALHARLGIERVVVVQPSPYGTDNSCTLDAAKQLGGRAVVVLPSGISELEIKELNSKGVRGVRVNLQTGGIEDPATAQRMLDEAVRPGWHVQVFTNLKLLKHLSCDTTLVIDHFGSPKDEDDARYLISLIRTKNTYVKLSGPHRCGVDPGKLTRELAEARPDRCLWGSDWPHPPGGARDPAKVQPFDRIDDAASLERLRAWLGDEALFRKILVDNPARLYDF